MPLNKPELGRQSWPSTSTRAHRFLILTGVAIFLGLCVWLFARQVEKQGFEGGLMLASVQRLNWIWLLAACAFAYLAYFGRALRWAVLIRPAKPHASLWNLTVATLIGFTAVTILGRPGEFIRPWLIARKEDLPMSSQVAAWLIERIFDLLIALSIFGFSLASVNRVAGAHFVPTGPLAWILQTGGYVVGIFCGLGVLLLFLIRRFSGCVQQRLADSLGFLSGRQLPKAEKLIAAFGSGMESLGSLAATIQILLYSILEWVLIAGCFISVLNAFGSSVSLTWLDAIVLMGFVSFGSIVQVPGIGGGVQVVTVIVLTQMFGLRLEIATTVALLIWAISFLVVVPAGVFFALREGLGWAALRRAEEETKA